MPFINEIIPEDFKKTFDFSIFKDIYGRPFAFEPFGQPKWTINKERNAFLLHVGGGGGQHVDAPRREMFAFWQEGKTAYFSGDEVVSQSEKGQILTWENPALTLTPEMEAQRNSLTQFINEALIARGLSNHPEWVRDVIIDFK